MSFSLLRRVRNVFSNTPDESHAVSRRGFIAGVGGAALGASLLMPDDAWAEVEDRAKRFGITPGTRVDAQGRPLITSSSIYDPTIGEITMFAGNFEPRNWAFCNGQLLSIAQNSALFSVIGTMYGGDGWQTFALPDLRGRFPMHFGQGNGLSNRVQGEMAGVEQVTLTHNEMPFHTHTTNEVQVRGTGTQGLGLATGGVRGAANLNPAGGSQPHNNMPPYLCVNFIIALHGIYPSRN